MSAVLTFPNFMTRLRIVRRRLKSGRSTYLNLKEVARVRIHKKLIEHNAHYGLKWNRFSVKNLKSRWGSCSRKGNLNFHYRIAFLPEPLFDYVVVHEICHLNVFNHSQEFWTLVAERVPDYMARRNALKTMIL